METLEVSFCTCKEDDDGFGRSRRARLVRPKRKIRERKREKKRKKRKATSGLNRLR
jgi:hypothetical protein